MRRWLAATAMVLLLLLGAATAVLWGRSYWIAESLFWESHYSGWAEHGHTCVDAYLWEGRLTFATRRSAPPQSADPIRLTQRRFEDFRNHFELRGRRQLLHYSGRRPRPLPGGVEYRREWSFAGFAYHAWVQHPAPFVAFPYYGTRIVIPVWPLFLAFCLSGLLFLRRWRRLVRQAQRQRLGLCQECGYDLRASKDRCPECGTQILPRMECQTQQSQDSLSQP